MTEDERRYRIALERLVIELGLLDRVDIRGPAPHHTVPGLYAEVDALVNDMREGATDKVVYEAAATCLPVIASNPAFDMLLPDELRFAHGDVEGLAAAIRTSESSTGTHGRLRETVVRLARSARSGWSRCRMSISGRDELWAERGSSRSRDG